jgi:uncharacterized protein YbbC (DUF1343 family)
MFFSFISCSQDLSNKNISNKQIEVGAQQTKQYLKLIVGKNVAVVANQTSVIFKDESNHTHLIDSLLSLNITIKKVFSPEHGFRGKADASEKIEDGIDIKTGLPIISLYGKNKKPSPEQLKGVDVVIFDIQDVGVRFYTYISTLHYVMEACAEQGILVIVLDRPNPNGHYIDGPTLEIENKSFVGMHPVPLVYGMTIGEYAQMINGEHWLKNKVTCDLTIVPLKNYNHNSIYSLQLRPSPNLPNDKSINLYPSLGFFEGTTINAGRGTENQFQQYGAPFFPKSEFTYTPLTNFGAKNPKHKDSLCNGINLKNANRLNTINIEWLIDAYQKTPKTIPFFGNTFTVHAGTTKLEKQIRKGFSADEIHQTWQPKIKDFKKIRKQYLLYE